MYGRCCLSLCTESGRGGGNKLCKQLLASRTDLSKNALHSTLLRSANEDSLRLEQISL